MCRPFRRSWGSAVTTVELTQFDGRWYREIPAAELRWEDGRWWFALPDDPGIVHLGIAPAPTTTWQTFVYHVCHGLIMHYPLWSVLTWSWRNRRSFVDPEVVDAIELPTAPMG